MRWSKRIFLAVTLGVAISASGMAAEESLTPSEESMLMSMLLPSLAVSWTINTLEESTSGSSGTTQRAQKAGVLPPMKVKAVRTRSDGGREVELFAEDEPAKTATLAWPARPDNPAEGFVVGQTVDFKPSAGGAGWIMRNRTGKALAFVPTNWSAQQAASERWR